jgi:hypothetical protein
MSANHTAFPRLSGSDICSTQLTITGVVVPHSTATLVGVIVWGVPGGGNSWERRMHSLSDARSPEIPLNFYIC